MPTSSKECMVDWLTNHKKIIKVRSVAKSIFKDFEEDGRNLEARLSILRKVTIACSKRVSVEEGSTPMYKSTELEDYSIVSLF
jgi:hypothetical protein